MNPLPSFLCIGAQKAGTSWLYGQLRQHPQIWLPPIKELHFFDHLYCPANRQWTQWHIQQAAKKIIKYQVNQAAITDYAYISYIANLASEPLFTPAWYQQAFTSHGAIGKVLGDITPEYCAIGDEGIRYVKELLGDVKIIWIIRDPIKRALSQLRMNAERAGLPKEATEAQWLTMAAAPEILNRGDYADYIPRWEKQFGSDGILFIPFRQIAQQPEHILKQLEKFLGVSEWDSYRASNEKVHATQAFQVPDVVTAFLHEQMQPQYRFLESHFGNGFLQTI